MSTSKRRFLIELYEEYLEEASFLYEQRLNLLENSAVSWKKIGEFEDRFEAHIDGLVVGKELATEICEKHAQGDDAGELHAAARVLCRHGMKDLLFSKLLGPNLKKPERVKALANALKYELPVGWYRDVQLVAELNPLLAPALMVVLGYRRAEITMEFPRMLRSSSGGNALDLIWTAGRIGNFTLQNDLEDLLESSDHAVRSATALALLRLGDQRTLRHCERSSQSETWQLIPLGLGGTRSTADVLINFTNASKAANDWLIALGLLGDVSAVPTLLANLSNPKNAIAAASALRLIGGADFSEKVFVPDEIEERADGKPFGTNIIRLSQKVEDWAGWWVDNEPVFDPRLRYRYGKPYSPLVLLEGLQCEKTPHRFRQLAYEELVIRYGMSIPFEADMFVSDQVKALQQIDEWIQANNGRFREGAWYFQGNLMYG
jgi:uncharacterized protein (TIGR02270 family)